ncbi:hypothetical protein M2281_000951 [Mesorhizobium soli]|uniref:hypothetical protein n=1 Tax=Pseudaminobacter soli (ex Li et al. 2025) TaxID=1295366 RepID=UPI002474EBBC|nr:hypothetical protein [Mesorhizobium soli]MDH6230379.1 hypothetical protein [Mesorhizobium soli]
MTSSSWAIPILAATLLAAPATAADMSSEKKPEEKAPKPTWTFGLELSPELYAIDNGSHRAGDFNNFYYKVSLSHTFAENFVGGVYFQHSFKINDQIQYYADARLGYKFKLSDSFTLTPGIGAGYTWRDTGVIKGSNNNADIAYYLITLAGDLKVTPKLTWNMFDLRYRNGFDAVWVTPKVATGLTYNFDSYNALFANVGYAWKKLDTNSPPYNALSGDKINIAAGFKRSF